MVLELKWLTSCYFSKEFDLLLGIIRLVKETSLSKDASCGQYSAATIAKLCSWVYFYEWIVLNR